MGQMDCVRAKRVRYACRGACSDATPLRPRLPARARSSSFARPRHRVSSSNANSTVRVGQPRQTTRDVIHHLQLSTNRLDVRDRNANDARRMLNRRSIEVGKQQQYNNSTHDQRKTISLPEVAPSDEWPARGRTPRRANRPLGSLRSRRTDRSR
jgi:hypothetical protein